MVLIAVAFDRTVVEQVDRVTRQEIAPRAAQYDEAGVNPLESWRELARHGFLAALVPEAYGGPGLGTPTYVAVIRTTGAGWPSTATAPHTPSTARGLVLAV